jgi:hypothetical protein
VHGTGEYCTRDGFVQGALRKKYTYISVHIAISFSMKLDVALPFAEHPSASASLEYSCGPAFLFFVSFISLAEIFSGRDV